MRHDTVGSWCDLGFYCGAISCFGRAEHRVLVEHSNTTASQTSAVAPPPVLTPMAWKCNSVPIVVRDETRGKWRLSLRYTVKKKKPVGKLSPMCDTREEAEVTSYWWRLSREQGHKGERIDLHTSPEVPAGDPLPPGGFMLLRIYQDQPLKVTYAGAADHAEHLCLWRPHACCCTTWTAVDNMQCCGIQQYLSNCCNYI